MKKNLFLLFSIYFFVIQPVIIGLLRGETNFFRLGGINFVAILLIGSLSGKGETEKKETNEHEKKHEVVKEATPSFHEHLRAAVKERKKKSELFFPFFISFVVTLFVLFMFQYHSIATEVLLLCSFIVGFVVFILLSLSFKHRITKKFWALWGTKIYLILLLAGLLFTAYDYYQVHKDFNASIQDYLAQNILGEERIPTDGYVFTGEGTVLGTGVGNTIQPQETSSDVFSGTTEPIIQEETGAVVDTKNNEPLPTDTTPIATTQGNQKLMDAVIYLLKKYNIPLITKQDMSFTYVTFSNPYYPQWRTAYANKLIGKTTNPSKYIICDSYIVMKGLLEKRDVPYTSSTVLNNFWSEAIKRNALNGCIKGKIVTNNTL